MFWSNKRPISVKQIHLMIWSSVIFTIEENKTVIIYVEFIISQIYLTLMVNTNLMQIIL